MYNEAIELSESLIEKTKEEIKKLSKMEDQDIFEYAIKSEFAKRVHTTLGSIIILEENISKNLSNLNQSLRRLHDIVASYKSKSDNTTT